MSASFLVSDPADREELASRLVFSSRGAEAAQLVFPTDTDAAAQPTPSPIPVPAAPLAASDDLLGVDRHEDCCATVHTIANFLLRNDTDREELVSMLRIQNTRAATVSANATTANAVASPSLSRRGAPATGPYGLDEREDIFNQLVMLETPALSTAPIFSKL
ncbi:hypothetical protein HDU96_005760 [Phlyctochytrium bullatum]|nr:hypothetical protein HDU96_005760 [Phlyctochytrium bullatum]